MLLSAVAAALRADPALKTADLPIHLLSPPPGARAPYAVVGPDFASDWSHKTGDGREHRFRVTLWSEARAVPGALLERVEAAVTALPSALDGHRLVSLRLIRSIGTQPADGGPAEHMIEFRARTLRAQ